MSVPPAPPGPFYATFGPADGALLNRHAGFALGVHDEPGGAGPPVGIAYPVGYVADPADPDRPPWATFRLVVHKTPLPGAWCLVGRDFMRT